jgi:ribonuclease D
MANTSTEPWLIDNNEALDKLCQSLINEPVLAVDTEFFRETTYFPHLGLIQVAGNNIFACIDPLAFDAREGVAKLLLNPAITKVFHACLQDLEVLYQYLGELPAPLADTQIAAAMLGYQDQIGYAKLVEEFSGVQLDKSQTRTNWLKRPLTSKQLLYAGDDVLYLLPIFEKLKLELVSKKRLDWFKQDCELLCTDTNRYQPDFDQCWQRVKGIYKLKDEQLAIAFSVAQWREQHAIQKDLTRRKMLPDDLLIQICLIQPANLSALNKVASLSRLLDDSQMDSLLEAVKTGEKMDPSDWPILNNGKPTPEQKILLNDMLTLLRNKAEKLDIPPAILGSRKSLEKMLEGERNIQLLKGWRLECIGKELLNCTTS